MALKDTAELQYFELFTFQQERNSLSKEKKKFLVQSFPANFSLGRKKFTGL